MRVVAVVTVVTVVTVVVIMAAVRVLVTVGRRLARVLLVRRARLGLNRLGLAVVVVMMVHVVPREVQLDAAERLPFRQELAELGVQFQQAKLRH
jgi:NAD(P)H-nitrite reductase large subunit